MSSRCGKGPRRTRGPLFSCVPRLRLTFALPALYAADPLVDHCEQRRRERRVSNVLAKCFIMIEEQRSQDPIWDGKHEPPQNYSHRRVFLMSLRLVLHTTRLLRLLRCRCEYRPERRTATPLDRARPVPSALLAPAELLGQAIDQFVEHRENHPGDQRKDDLLQE